MEEPKSKNKSTTPPKTIKGIVKDLRSRGELDEGKWTRYHNKFYLTFIVLLLATLCGAAYLYYIEKNVWLSLTVITAGVGLILYQYRQEKFQLQCMNYTAPVDATIISIKQPIADPYERYSVKYIYKVNGLTHGPFATHFFLDTLDKDEIKHVSVVHHPINHRKHTAFIESNKYNWKRNNLRKEKNDE